MTVYARTHVHSTVAGNELLDDTLKFFVCSDSRVERSRAHVVIPLIWMKGIVVLINDRCLILIDFYESN
jgi:hypothetical protein